MLAPTNETAFDRFLMQAGEVEISTASMRHAHQLPNGNLMVPMRAESADGLIGDAMIEVEPGSPEFEEWLPWAVDTEEIA